MRSLMQNVKMLSVMDPVVAGTSDQNGAIVDTAGYDGIAFLAMFGALTTSQVTRIKVQTGAAANLSDAADLATSYVGPLLDADVNNCLWVEALRPRERYVRCVVDRHTANAVIDGVIAFLFRGASFPTVHDATTVQGGEQHVSPTEGTA